MLSITITPTDMITTLDGIPVRVWHGLTADGVPCKVFVHRIRVDDGHDASAFEHTLREQLPPASQVPLSMIS